jgi:beta-lactamase regulating signal transducer with metallopeptidase domain/predicted  nucleic acid-binding Zn-ribbon protein
MTLPAEFLNLTDAAGAWLLTYLLHSTLLLGVALIVCRWLGDRRLSLQESLVRVALLGGLLTASLQSGLGWQAATGSIPYPSARPASVESVVPAGDEFETPSMPAGEPRDATRESHAAAAAAGEATTSGDSVRFPWLAFALALWAATGCLLLGRLGLLAVRLSSRLRGRIEVTRGRVFRTFWRLLAVADVDKPTRLTRSARLDVPIALGVGRREISLPDRVVEQLPDEQQETVLAHELAHLERHDPTWLLVARVVESVLFVQPLNRIARRKLQEIAEYRCDDWAARFTGRPLTLAKCLTNVATWTADRRLSALAPTMAGRRSGLGLRVRRLLEPGYSGLDPRLPSWWRPLAGAGLVVVIVAVPGFSTVDQEEAPPAPEPPAVSEPSVVEAPEPPRPAAPAGVEAPRTPPEVPEPPESAAPEAEVPEAEPAAPAPPAPASEPTAGDEPLPAAPKAPPVLPDALEPVVAPLPEPVPATEIDVKIAPAVEVETRVTPDDEVRVATRVARNVIVKPRVATRVEARHRIEVATPVVVRIRQEPDETREGQSEQERDPHRHPDYDTDDDWEDELEDELDALEDELDQVMDELEETIDFELESVLDGLEDEMDALEDELEELFELELEAFEEQLEDEFEAFEDELDALEERVEDRLESVGWEAREERFEREIEAIEDSFDRLEDQLDDELDRIEERLEDRVGRVLDPMVDHELERRIDAIEDRFDREADRLEEMAERMSEEAYSRGERHLSSEDREELLAEARRVAEEARPDAEEIERLRSEIERLGDTVRPSEAEVEKIRQELLESLEALRQKAEEGLAREKAELQKLRQKHKVL